MSQPIHSFCLVMLSNRWRDQRKPMKIIFRTALFDPMYLLHHREDSAQSLQKILEIEWQLGTTI
jgi:hypothetical protein